MEKLHFKDKEFAYFYDIFGFPTKMEGVDVKSFRPFGTSKKFMQDDKALYYWGHPLEGVDLASVKIVENLTSKGGDYITDKNNVYTINFKNGIPYASKLDEANPATFEVIQERSVIKDATHVFYNGKILEDADPATFEIIGDSKQYMMGKDKNAAYIAEFKIGNIDSATFQFLDCYYLKDNTYRNGLKL